MIIIGFLVFFLSSLLPAEQHTFMDEFDDIEQIIRRLERDLPERLLQEPPPVRTELKKPEPVVVPEPEPKPKPKPKPEPEYVEEVEEYYPLPVVEEIEETFVEYDYDISYYYIDERSNKQSLKHGTIRDALIGPSLYVSPSRNIDMDRDDVYHYAYAPPQSGEAYGSDGRYEGKFGQLVFSLYIGRLSYRNEDITRSTFGSNVQLGWQLSISRFALALLMDSGVRGSNIKGHNVYTIGPRGRVVFRASNWLFPFFEAGADFAKPENMGNWVYPYTVISGGLMLNFGRLDSRSEFNLHRDYNVARFLLIIAGEYSRTPELGPNTPDSAMFKIGIGVEFF